MLKYKNTLKKGNKKHLCLKSNKASNKKKVIKKCNELFRLNWRIEITNEENIIAYNIYVESTLKGSGRNFKELYNDLCNIGELPF